MCPSRKALSVVERQRRQAVASQSVMRWVAGEAMRDFLAFDRDALKLMRLA